MWSDGIVINTCCVFSRQDPTTAWSDTTRATWSCQWHSRWTPETRCDTACCYFSKRDLGERHQRYNTRGSGEDVLWEQEEVWRWTSATPSLPTDWRTGDHHIPQEGRYTSPIPINSTFLYVLNQFGTPSRWTDLQYGNCLNQTSVRIYHWTK